MKETDQEEEDNPFKEIKEVFGLEIKLLLKILFIYYN